LISVAPNSEAKPAPVATRVAGHSPSSAAPPKIGESFSCMTAEKIGKVLISSHIITIAVCPSV
jgi:hypothetical protein